MTSSFDPSDFRAEQLRAQLRFEQRLEQERLEQSRHDPQPERRQSAPRAAYSRFIPREELNSFAAWQPNAFGFVREAPPVSARPDPELLRRQAELAAEREAALQAELLAQAEAEQLAEAQAAHDQIYQDGYRDGLAALEAFKQSHAAQTGAQLAAMVLQLQAQFDQIEQQLARRVAGIALDVARQVVRSELRSNPLQVVAVIEEALSVLLMSARHVCLRVNPQDHAVVVSGAAESLAARGVRLLADPQIEAGGCLVESDIGVVDARVATRWQRASAALGGQPDWSSVAEPLAST
jgi:flagellar assembly protein FliH